MSHPNCEHCNAKTVLVVLPGGTMWVACPKCDADELENEYDQPLRAAR